jgi:hemerythrin-like domain-containing protein
MGLADPLRAEHSVLRLALVVLQTAAERVAKGEPIAQQTVLELVRTISHFGEQEHAGKEEHALFPALHAAGMPMRYGPLAVMLLEHERARELSRHMARAASSLGATDMQDAFSKAAQEYVVLVGGHINREESVLFPMADQVVALERLSAVREAFARMDRDRPSGGPETVRTRLETLQKQMEGAPPSP